MLVEQLGFHLAQEFFWWNPSKLPTPAEWVTVRRIRVKDAINTIWWLSPTPYPRASNRRVLQPYSDSMEELLEKGYKAKRRPSGHNISKKFSKRNKGAIPPNLLALANTESNSFYLRYCKERDIKPHPARFPLGIPEYFIRMLTEPGDLVVDPFAGSCVTGEAAEALKRRWICIDMEEDYLQGALGRFQPGNTGNGSDYEPESDDAYYKIPRPGLLWEEEHDTHLPTDGGRTRPKKRKLKKGPESEVPEPESVKKNGAQLRLLESDPTFEQTTDEQEKIEAAD
jgi:site-specific DNA-methyltransferase (cytosine-N4-specific)